MITLILAGGRSVRFADAGYLTPKPLLPVGNDFGLPIIVHLLDCLTPATLIVASHRDLEHDLEPVLQRWCEDHPTIVKKQHFVWVDHDRGGPLSGAMDVRKFLKTHEELVICYCDIIPWVGQAPLVLACREANAKAGAVVFKSDDARFGRTPDGKRAVSGLFYFREACEFVRLARGFPLNDVIGIPHVVWATKHIEVEYEPDAEFWDVGTPEAYERLCGIHKPQTL